MHDARGIVDEISGLDSTGYVPINKESQRIRFPINLLRKLVIPNSDTLGDSNGEIMPIGVSIGQTHFSNTIGGFG